MARIIQSDLNARAKSEAKFAGMVGKRLDVIADVGVSVDAPMYFAPESKEQTISIPQEGSPYPEADGPKALSKILKRGRGSANSSADEATTNALGGLQDLLGPNLQNLSSLGQFGGSQSGGSDATTLDIPEMKRILRKILRAA